MKAKTRYYIVWLNNNTDRRDDEPIKVKAESRGDACRVASDYLRGRFCIGRVFSLSEFKTFEPWWHRHFWGKEAINEGE